MTATAPTAPTPPPPKVHPAFKLAFTEGDQTTKRTMILQLFHDWLVASRNGWAAIDHCGALLELLDDSSAARQLLIDSCIVTAITQSLGSANTNMSAAAAAAAWIQRRPSSVEPLAAALADTLLDEPQRRERLFDGFERLASSSAASAQVLEIILQRRMDQLLSAPPAFEHAKAGFGDLGRLRTLLPSQHLYASALTAAGL